MPVFIDVDEREVPSGIVDILAGTENVRVEVKRLLSGDYCVNGRILVERKTARGFVMSIIDTRLFLQASRMSCFPGRKLFIIEGEDLLNTGVDIHPRAIRGALVSLSTSWCMPVLFSRSVEETVELLLLAGGQDVAFFSERGKRKGRIPKSFDRLQLYVLQGLPGVGRSRAAALLETFGSIENVMSAGVEDLGRTAGIGERRAVRIREVITGKVERAQLQMTI